MAFDQRRTVIAQRDRAASAQVAGTARSVRSTDPRLGRRLAIAAAGLADTPESWSALEAVRYPWATDAVRLPGFVPAFRRELVPDEAQSLGNPSAG
ncbi:hypothetical protein OV450_5630 [Actinobacteria bacterium OV450]|nr:hypothetical protein OV450_5630 [Actinobacteria bacterium OV450]